MTLGRARSANSSSENACASAGALLENSAARYACSFTQIICEIPAAMEAVFGRLADQYSPGLLGQFFRQMQGKHLNLPQQQQSGLVYSCKVLLPLILALVFPCTGNYSTLVKIR